MHSFESDKVMFTILKNRILPLLAFVILHWSNHVLGNTPVRNKIDCYRCNNGYAANPKCVSAPNKDPKVIPLINSQDPDCLSIIEFFAKYNMVTNEWNKRIWSGRGKHRPRRDTTDVTVTLEEGFCATVIVYTINYEAIPLVYRDCIKGDLEEIERSFRIQFDFDLGKTIRNFTMPSRDSRESVCNSKVVNAESGTKTIDICLCQADKCNTLKARSAGGSGRFEGLIGALCSGSLFFLLLSVFM